MEKVSSILAASPRIKAVDLEEDHPVRPGAPTFGRKEGITAAQRDKITISPQAKDAAFAETMAARNPRIEEATQARIRNTDKFFESREALKEPGEAEAEIAHNITSDFNKVATVAARPGRPGTGPEVGPSRGAVNRYA